MYPTALNEIQLVLNNGKKKNVLDTCSNNGFRAYLTTDCLEFLSKPLCFEHFKWILDTFHINTKYILKEWILYHTGATLASNAVNKLVNWNQTQMQS